VHSDPHPDLSALSALAPELASAMVRVASDVALVIDGEGVIRSVAESPASIGDGTSPGWNEWLGRRWVETVATDSRRKVELLLEEARSGSTTRRREINHPLPGGHEIPLAWTAIRLGRGGPVVAVGRDLRAVAAIQQRFLDAQQELERDYWRRREAEGRYQRLFRVASDAVLVLDAETLQLLESNDAALALFGGAADAGEPDLRPWPQRLPAGAHNAVHELLVTARRSGRAAELRVHGFVAADGTAMDCDLAATPFRAQGRLELLLNARRAASGAASALQMASYVEATSDAVVVTDSAGRIQMANPAFVAWADHGSESQLRGQALLDLLGDGAAGWRELFEQARHHGVAPQRALRAGAAFGHRLLMVGASLLTDGEQEAIGLTLRLAPEGATPPAATTAPEGATAPAAARWGADPLLRLGRAPMRQLLDEARTELERRLAEAALLRCHGDRGATAALLGLEPAALGALLVRLGLRAESFAHNDPDDPTRAH
jgi:transcriptional regulator PpsR